jgi:diguanylate cyclase (GGDEF)-like protein
MAEILKATFRISDIKARMSGDEFAVFPIDTTLAGVETALARLAKAIAEFNASDQKPFKLGISTGIACYDPANPSSIEDLLNRADNLMYENKRKKASPAPRK